MNKNFKNKNLKAKRKIENMNKGITLIALIITIIVLLILAVVAIRSVQGDGILAKAKKARDDYQSAIQNEEETLQNYTDYIEGQVEKNPPKEESSKSLVELYKEGTLKVGDYVDYKPTTATSAYDPDDGATPGTKTGFVSDVQSSWGTYQGGDRQNITQESLNWRILGYDEENEELLLISGAPTTQRITLYGHIGYNNAEDILNTACSTLYSNNSLGAIARSIKMNDIDFYLDGNNFDKTTFGGGSSEAGGYGYRKIFGNKNIYTPENWIPSKVLSLTSQFYWFDASDYIQDKIKLNLLLGNDKQYMYWIASRFLYVGEDMHYLSDTGSVALWSAGFVYQDEVCAGSEPDWEFLCASEGSEYGSSFWLRPVVSLKKNVTTNMIPVLEVELTETWNESY